MRSTSTVSRIHAARHHGFAGTVDSGGETTWVTRPDYEGNPHHGLVTTALRRAAASLVVVGAALMLIPAAASAHALLASASPKPGAHLGTAPGVVVLEFSQTLNAQLSHATLTDPTGHRWNGEVDSGEEIRIPLATNASGVYTVDWTTVSQVDGHLITGSFTFDVGVVGSGSSQEAANAVPGPAASDIAIGTVKWVEALALLFLVGQVLVGGLARRAPPLEWVQPRFRAASVALSAGLVVVWAEATVGSGGHSISGYLSYFGAGLSGAALIARLGFEALALVAVVRGWWTLPLWLAGALAMLAAGGHAAGVQPAWIGIGLDAVHLAAAGLWAGGIAALASVRPPGGWRSSEARALIRRFSPVALGAFGATVVAGGLEAVMQLGSVQSLVGTAYGRVLIAKMALVALMLPLSVMAWRLGRPKVRIEAAIAVCVVAAAALLASFPAPPSAAAEKAAELASATPSAGLPSPGALTMAGPAGSVLVGLSLSPGKPGPNRALVYLVPITGTAAAAALPANIAVNGVYKALGSCGDTCRTATVDIQSGDAVAIDVLGVGGGEAKFVMPKLPAPSGSALLSRMQSAMHTLSGLPGHGGAVLGDHHDQERVRIRCPRPHHVDGGRDRSDDLDRYDPVHAHRRERPVAQGDRPAREHGAVLRMGLLRTVERRARPRERHVGRSTDDRRLQLREQAGHRDLVHLLDRRIGPGPPGGDGRARPFHDRHLHELRPSRGHRGAAARVMRTGVPRWQNGLPRGTPPAIDFTCEARDGAADPEPIQSTDV